VYVLVALPSRLEVMLVWSVRFGFVDRKSTSNLSALWWCSRVIWHESMLWWLCHHVWKWCWFGWLGLFSLVETNTPTFPLYGDVRVIWHR
jgi:hypothetical protein